MYLIVAFRIRTPAARIGGKHSTTDENWYCFNYSDVILGSNQIQILNNMTDQAYFLVDQKALASEDDGFW